MHDFEKSLIKMRDYVKTYGGVPAKTFDEIYETLVDNNIIKNRETDNRKKVMQFVDCKFKTTNFSIEDRKELQDLVKAIIPIERIVKRKPENLAEVMDNLRKISITPNMSNDIVTVLTDMSDKINHTENNEATMYSICGKQFVYKYTDIELKNNGYKYKHHEISTFVGVNIIPGKNKVVTVNNLFGLTEENTTSIAKFNGDRDKSGNAIYDTDIDKKILVRVAGTATSGKTPRYKAVVSINWIEAIV